MTVDVAMAAALTQAYLPGAQELPGRGDEPYSHPHLHWMLIALMTEEVTGDKAHRWLGWVQCAIVVGGGATLEQMKAANKRASETDDSQG